MARRRTATLFVVLAALVVAACSSTPSADPDDVGGGEVVVEAGSEAGSDVGSEEGRADDVEPHDGPQRDAPADRDRREAAPPPSEDAAEAEAEDADEGPRDDDVEEIIGATEVDVYFTRSGDGAVWVEPETRQLDHPTVRVARAAMTLLFSVSPDDPALSTAAPASTEVLDVHLDERTLIVDVSSAVRTRGGGSAQEMAFALQFVHTATSFPTVDDVWLWIDGAPVDELWGHLDWSAPLAPDPLALSPITIVEPAVGAAVETGRVTVGGEARVYEATVAIEVRGPDGRLLEDTSVTATAGGPVRGSWQYTFTVTTPGEHTVTVTETDPSDGEGRRPFTASRTVTVR